ncbi:MAG TPA: tetratricopeptide repeat protein [Afifellaceae bacterium]|nr:tetratricopeptide repeat protein [Afifellaceae bacterium]
MSVRPLRVLLAALALGAALATGAAAQSEREAGEMRLYIRQLEEQVRLLTGEVEQLRHQVRLMQQGGAGVPQGQIGQPAGSEPQWQTAQPGGEPQWQTAQPGGEQQWPTEVIVDPAQAPGANSSAGAGAPPAQLGSVSVGQDDPRIARDNDPGQAGAPLDLSVLAGGSAGAGGGFDGLRGSDQAAPVPLPETVEVPQQPDWTQLGQAPQPAPQMAALGGSANDQYDLAYGYVLTGDYGLAEQGFRQWLQANAGHPLAGDAEFWLAESMLRQDKHREAANLFLKVYKTAPQGRKGPDSLAKLGVALAALGEQSAACATFQELDLKHPEASDLVRSQVAAASQRVGC